MTLPRVRVERAQRGPVDEVVSLTVESVDGNGQPVLEVAATDPVELRAAAPPRDVAKLRVGMPANLRLEL